MSNEAVLSVRNLHKSYPLGKTLLSAGKADRGARVRAVDGVDLDVAPGEILGIIGESGCGKSTLGRLLTRLELPSSGDIFHSGVPQDKLYMQDPLKFRRSVQMIFQNPFDTFDPRDTVRRIMLRALRMHGIASSDAERLHFAAKVMDEVGLSPAQSFLDRHPHELSGGQMQRISIVRSMLLSPSFIVADEPISMLDISIRAEIIHMLKALSEERGVGMIFINHDIASTRYVADRIAVMYLGQIVESGNTENVIRQPLHPYTCALISSCAGIDPDAERTSIVLKGEPPSAADHFTGCRFAPRCLLADESCTREMPGLEMADGERMVRCRYPGVCGQSSR